MNLLEKEMPRTGGSNFGDYYLDKNFKERGESGKNSFSANIYTNQVNKNLKQEEINNLRVKHIKELLQLNEKEFVIKLVEKINFNISLVKLIN